MQKFLPGWDLKQVETGLDSLIVQAPSPHLSTRWASGSAARVMLWVIQSSSFSSSEESLTSGFPVRQMTLSRGLTLQ